MRIDLLDYELPPECIAQHPSAEREDARLLRLGASDNGPTDHRVADLPNLLPPRSLIVVNDTRVIPARLQGVKASSGGRVEIFLVRKIGVRSWNDGTSERAEAEVWRALGKSSKPLRSGAKVLLGEGLCAEIVERSQDDGLLEVVVWTTNGMPLSDAIQANGHVPLPPYIKRDDTKDDAKRYQTVFARVDGAVAAPTAGLHLTDALIDRLKARGHSLATVTLHVGLGTFQPVTVDDLDDHPMHSERIHVPAETARAISQARVENRPVVAIGTTVARTLESASCNENPGYVRPFEGETRLLIQPGYSFNVVDHLFTNFHLPKSTLLAMVSAFAGRERILASYKHAISEGYRFFSYGDAMLLERANS